MNFALVVPTLNGGDKWKAAAAKISDQHCKPNKVLVIDSESSDATNEVTQSHGFGHLSIPQKEFDHGGTRQLAVEQLKEHQVIVFMTQDAILANDEALANLLKPFSDKKVAISYGRQLPHKNANPIEAHARYFNYPAESSIKSAKDIKNLGIKTAFCSNSFAAYRTSTLLKLGGFPKKNILSEDMLVGAKAILKGYKIAYQADSLCYHSHDYSLLEESKRMFDIGVFHRRNHWILEDFGSAHGEGFQFLKSELTYIAQKKPLATPGAVMRTGVKFLAYKTGFYENLFDCDIKSKLSRNKGFWMQPEKLKAP